MCMSNDDNLQAKKKFQLQYCGFMIYLKLYSFLFNIKKWLVNTSMIISDFDTGIFVIIYFFFLNFLLGNHTAGVNQGICIIIVTSDRGHQVD